MGWEPESLCQNPWLLAVNLAHHRNVHLWAKTNIGTWFMYEAERETRRTALFLTRKRSMRTCGRSLWAFPNYYEIGRWPTALRDALFFRPQYCLEVNKRPLEDLEKIITYRLLQVRWPLNQKFAAAVTSHHNRNKMQIGPNYQHLFISTAYIIICFS